ncbi:protein adenylyltransferase SelO family protein [Rhizorhabdus dicambivorans]|uniref:Selenoprotein O n=1 Tax=Rhizorhabdus dicambivorans TaxID=1850238 RepID=A0A2A4FQ77_9SPHN|nr:YdiU family protein [Rhizorhabdus dicambivorans]ATE64486.1 selenoprotein O [Rhizorhabdus dicambivorans]PCE39826.1 selenoprotein O [Rhizorhabdus dicambivorans]
MPIAPQAAAYRADPKIETIRDRLSDPVAAADFPQAILRFRNRRWDGAVGLDSLSDEQWIAHFGRFEPLPGNLPQPLALRYHGHQFRHYNPDIGDGRGFLFAQLRDGEGRLLDLGTKGSGQTPYSRFGDGRLTLKGGVREILATEMLEALGVETSKTFSLIETGEALQRNDEPSPTRSSVLVRLSHGHIRIGSFQRLATLGEADTMRDLMGYTLTNLYGETPGNAPAGQLLDLVCRRTAALAASYMAAGFVHGVLNSDNINVTGESFDYGPWRFNPTWNPGFTAAYFDQQGLYAFGRQAQAIHWDVVELARSLRTVAEAEELAPALDGWPGHYERDVAAAICGRLGVAPRGEEADLALLQAMDSALQRSQVGIDRFFFDWRGGARRAASPADALYDGEDFAGFRAAIADYRGQASLDHDYWRDPEPCSMLIDEVEAIWSAIDEHDDWGPLHAKVDAIRRMGEAMRL